MERELPAVDGIEHRFVDAGGLRTHFAEAGQGPPLLLVHGWPQHWYMWHRLIGPLAESHRVICPDLRGFGWTAAPPNGYDPEVFARDLVALLDALEVEGPVDYAGHDWGGWAGYLLALHHPERIRRLLTLNIVPPFARATPRAIAEGWRFWYQAALGWPILGRLGVQGITSIASPAIRWVGARPGIWNEAETETYLSQFRESERAAATSRLYRHALLGIPRRLAGYRRLLLPAPTLLVFGTDDAVQKRIPLDGYERNAPRMTVEQVDGVGHFIVDEAPELVLERALRFFA